MADEYRFVITGPAVPPATTRLKELVQAENKSHAAKVSHSRRKKLQSKGSGSLSQDGEALKGIHNWHLWLNTGAESRDHSKGGYELLRQYARPGALSAPDTVRFLSSGGSTDPFDTLGFTITPEMSRIISIARHTFLPSLYVFPFMKRLSTRLPVGVNPSAKALKFVEDNVGLGFVDARCPAGWIACHTTSLLRFHDGQQKRDLGRMVLQLKSLSLKRLRDQAASLSERGSDPADASFAMHVLWLHAIECMAGDMESAKAHARILSGLLPAFRGAGAQFIEIAIFVMFNETELACRKMQRTNMDFKHCFGKDVEAVAHICSLLIPPPPQDYDDLHPSIASPELRSICGRVRHFVSLSESPEPVTASEDPASGEIIYAWLAITSQYDTDLLLSRALDLMETRPRKVSLGMWYTDACLTLTALHLLRKYLYYSPMGGVDLRDASQPIMSKLRRAFRLAMEHCTPDELDYHREAYLWILFTGAQHEVQWSRKTKFEDDNNSSDFFRSRLAQQVKLLDVARWEDARPVLAQFLYTDTYEPHADQWFEDTISAYDAEQG